MEELAAPLGAELVRADAVEVSPVTRPSPPRSASPARRRSVAERRARIRRAGGVAPSRAVDLLPDLRLRGMSAERAGVTTGWARSSRPGASETTHLPTRPPGPIRSRMRRGGAAPRRTRDRVPFPACRGSAAWPRRSRCAPSGTARLKMRLQEPACVRRLARGDCLRACRSPRLRRRRAALGTEVDHVIGRLDDVEVVLDQEHRVAGVDEAVQRREQALDVGQVQPGRRLVEDVERVLRSLQRAQLRGDLDPLRLAARERRRRLAEREVAEPRSASTSIFLPDVGSSRRTSHPLRPTCSGRRRWSCRAASLPVSRC